METKPKLWQLHHQGVCAETRFGFNRALWTNFSTVFPSKSVWGLWFASKITAALRCADKLFLKRWFLLTTSVNKAPVLVWLFNILVWFMVETLAEFLGLSWPWGDPAGTFTPGKTCPRFDGQKYFTSLIQNRCLPYSSFFFFFCTHRTFCPFILYFKDTFISAKAHLTTRICSFFILIL